jgi:hypothetical protein
LPTCCPLAALRGAGYHDRKLADPTIARTLKEFVTQLPVAFEVYADLSKRKVKMFDHRKRQQKRAMRTAQLVFHAAPVGLKRPTHHARVRAKLLDFGLVKELESIERSS